MYTYIHICMYTCIHSSTINQKNVLSYVGPVVAERRTVTAPYNCNNDDYYL